MDNIAIWTAVIVAVPTVLATTIVPLLTKRSDNRVRKQERAEDAERLRETERKADEVATKAAEAARLLVQNTAKAAEATKETNIKLAEVAKVTGVIHALVNSQLTESKQREFDAIERELALLQEIGGPKPSPRIAAAIKTAEASLTELGAILADRKITQDGVDRQKQDQAR